MWFHFKVSRVNIFSIFFLQYTLVPCSEIPATILASCNPRSGRRLLLWFNSQPHQLESSDIHDDHVLFSAVSLSEGRGDFIDATSNTFVDLVVCDPLSRRYIWISPVPEDLAAGE